MTPSTPAQILNISFSDQQYHFKVYFSQSWPIPLLVAIPKLLYLLPLYLYCPKSAFRHRLSQVSVQTNFSPVSKLCWGGGNGGCLDDSVDAQATVENHKHDALINKPCWQVRNQSSLAQRREDEHFNASGFYPVQLTPHTAYCSPKAINHTNKCHIIHRSWNHKNENEEWLRKN